MWSGIVCYLYTSKRLSGSEIWLLGFCSYLAILVLGFGASEIMPDEEAGTQYLGMYLEKMIKSIMARRLIPFTRCLLSMLVMCYAYEDNRFL
jgi:hypothetical protein